MLFYKSFETCTMPVITMVWKVIRTRLRDKIAIGQPDPGIMRMVIPPTYPYVMQAEGTGSSTTRSARDYPRQDDEGR